MVVHPFTPNAREAEAGALSEAEASVVYRGQLDYREKPCLENTKNKMSTVNEARVREGLYTHFTYSFMVGMRNILS